MTVQPRIYVACPAAYNNGRLHGVWIDLTDPGLDTMWAQVTAMLAASPEPYAEEWAIHDDEGFAPCRISEYEPLEHVAKIATGMREHGEAFAAWASVWDSTDVDELDRFEDMYCGSFDSLTEFANELLDGLGIESDPQYWAPDILVPYVHVDIDVLAHSLTDTYSVVEGPTQLHIFTP